MEKHMENKEWTVVNVKQKINKNLKSISREIFTLTELPEIKRNYD